MYDSCNPVRRFPTPYSEHSNLWDLAAAILASIAQMDFACIPGLQPMLRWWLGGCHIQDAKALIGLSIVLLQFRNAGYHPNFSYTKSQF